MIPWYWMYGIEGSWNYKWYCVHEVYIKSRVYPLEICRVLFVLTSIWLVECFASLTSSCMLLPYPKGLILIKKYFMLFSNFLLNLFLSNILLYVGLLQVVSELFHKKSWDFFPLFLHKFLGKIVGMDVQVNF